MSRSGRIIAVGAAIVAVATLVFAASGGPTRDFFEVLVTNFPDVQTIDGTVRMTEPIRSAKAIHLGEVLVSPVGRADTIHLISGGSLVTDGFGEIVLSLVGQVKGEVTRPGDVGVVLLPDEEPIVQAFEEKDVSQFTIEAAAEGVSGGSPYFKSNQPRRDVGFPRYRVLFYNTTDRSVTVHLYAYLVQ